MKMKCENLTSTARQSGLPKEAGTYLLSLKTIRSASSHQLGASACKDFLTIGLRE